TELILSKRLDNLSDEPSGGLDSARFTVSKDSTKEAQMTVRRGLGKNFDDHVGELLKKYPQIPLQLIIRKNNGEVIGGFCGYSILGTMTIDDLWVHARYRGQGYGTDLLEHAEAIARERKCMAVQTACFSFQNLAFLRGRGFEPFGVSDVYPKSVKEYYLIKRL
ncbi:GNAT family N-acetyltransferase, partial [Candidatus Thorarchaeota archaeon]